MYMYLAVYSLVFVVKSVCVCLLGHFVFSKGFIYKPLLTGAADSKHCRDDEYYSISPLPHDHVHGHHFI